MLQVILLAVMVLLYTGQSLFCRLYTSARNGEGAIPFAIFYAAFTGFFTLAFNGFRYSASLTTILLGLINAGAILAYNVCMVKAGNLGSYAFMMIGMLSGSIIVPMLYDHFYLKTSFSMLQIIAVVLMLDSFVVMYLNGFQGKKNSRYLLLVVLLFLVNGAYSVMMNLQQTLMNHTQRTEMIVNTFLGMALITSAVELIVSRKKFVDGFRMSRKAWIFMLLSSVCATVAVNLLMIAMAKIGITVMNVVLNGGILILSAVSAFTLFKEKVTANAVIGIAMACVSIVILSL